MGLCVQHPEDGHVVAAGRAFGVCYTARALGPHTSAELADHSTAFLLRSSSPRLEPEPCRSLTLPPRHGPCVPWRLMMDIIGLYKRSRAGFVARVRGVRPKGWSRAPCTDWDVPALVHYVVEEERYRIVLDPVGRPRSSPPSTRTRCRR